MPQALRKVAKQGREDCRELRSLSQKNAFAALACTGEQIGEIVHGDVAADKRLIEASLLAGRYLAVRQLGLAARRQSDAFPDTAVSDTAVAGIVV